MYLKVADIIPKPFWQFPLSNELFEKLMLVEQFEYRATTTNKEGVKINVTDFDILFRLIISQMVKSGVKFFSPGGSYKRRFMFWFNAHFWHNMEFEYNVNVNIGVKYFKKIYQLAANNLALPIIDFANSPSITITESDHLTDLGKEFIKAILPFSTYNGTINFAP